MLAIYEVSNPWSKKLGFHSPTGKMTHRETTKPGDTLLELSDSLNIW